MFPFLLTSLRVSVPLFGMFPFFFLRAVLLQAQMQQSIAQLCGSVASIADRQNTMEARLQRLCDTMTIDQNNISMHSSANSGASWESYQAHMSRDSNYSSQGK